MPVKANSHKAAVIRAEMPEDEVAITQLMAATFGSARHQRAVRHLRLCPAEQALCFVQQVDGVIVGSIRYWPILVGGKKQLLLGPLAIDPDHKGRGYGRALVSHSLSHAAKLAYDFVLISGEPDYYPRFGFAPADAAIYLWPGFIEEERLQIKWLKPDEANSSDGPMAILPIIA